MAEINRIVAFGDSFTRGTELSDSIDYWDATVIENQQRYKKEHAVSSARNIGPYSEVDQNHKLTTIYACYSEKTWPALLAKYLNVDYECYATSGSSNQTILRNLIKYIPHITLDDLVIINWTYISRSDFYDPNVAQMDRRWVTISPTDENSTKFSSFYYKYIQSELWDKWESLKLILLAISLLKTKQINFRMTCIDKLIMDQTYHSPSYIKNAQSEINEYIQWFEGMGFNDWVSKYHFTRGENNHPLEEAHIAAFNYIKKQNKFNTIKKQQFNIPQSPSSIQWNNSYSKNYTIEINYDTK